jgi:hypothetical protein
MQDIAGHDRSNMQARDGLNPSPSNFVSQQLGDDIILMTASSQMLPCNKNTKIQPPSINLA